MAWTYQAPAPALETASEQDTDISILFYVDPTNGVEAQVNIKSTDTGGRARQRALLIDLTNTSLTAQQRQDLFAALRTIRDNALSAAGFVQS